MSGRGSPDDLSCWVISDGRRGIENQAWGLAEAVSAKRPLDISKHVLMSGKAFRAATPLMQFALKSDVKSYGLKEPFPDIAIGCGRQAVAPLLALKKADPNCFTVYVQDPKIDIQRFDLVVAPEHDELSGDNVETMIGSPNRVTPNRLAGDVKRFETQLKSFPKPQATLLIGGPSKTFRFSKADHENHIAAALDFHAKGYSLLITVSRRTPEWAVTDYLKLAEEGDNIWVHADKGDNPYFAFLGSADILCVTSDSTNMLTEACATGKPVFLLPLSGQAGKFENLYRALEARCNVKTYTGDISSSAYEPLNETARVAELLWAHYDRRAAILN